MRVDFHMVGEMHVAVCANPNFYIAARTLDEVCAEIPKAIAALASATEQKPRLRVVKT